MLVDSRAALKGPSFGCEKLSEAKLIVRISKGHYNHREKWRIFPLSLHNSVLPDNDLWQNTKSWPKCFWVAFSLKGSGKPGEVI